MKAFMFVLGAALAGIGIAIGMHPLSVNVSTEVISCGSGFSPQFYDIHRDYAFTLSYEQQKQAVSLCLDKHRDWQLYGWCAIGLGGAVMLGSVFLNSSGTATQANETRSNKAFIAVAVAVVAVAVGVWWVLAGPAPWRESTGNSDAAATTTQPEPTQPEASSTTDSPMQSPTTSQKLWTSTSPTTTRGLAPATVTLPASRKSDGQGSYVPIESRRFATRCYVETNSVTCQLSSEMPGKGNGFTIYDNGEVHWGTGNMGQDTYQLIQGYGGPTYKALGWTITSSGAGLRFTNDTTEHGVMVTANNADPY